MKPLVLSILALFAVPAAGDDAFPTVNIKFENKQHPTAGAAGAITETRLRLWKKRGAFQTMLSRDYGPRGTVPASPVDSEPQLSQEEIAEIEYRFEALKPYQKPGSPDFAAAGP